MGQDKRRICWQEIIIHIKSIRKNWQRKRKEKKRYKANWIKKTYRTKGTLPYRMASAPLSAEAPRLIGMPSAPLSAADSEQASNEDVTVV